MEEKILTYGIPTHNNLNYLKLCIKSILENSFHKNQPIIIYAEGCTDGTNEWLEKDFLNHSQVTYHIKEERWNDTYWGIGGGLNFIASLVKTEYFLPLHSDMYVGYHFDKELVSLCQANEKLVISSYRIEPNVFKSKKSNTAQFEVVRPGTSVCDIDTFGHRYDNFNHTLFTTYSKQFQLLNTKEYRKGEGAGGFIIRKSDWIDNDPLFAPASYEDKDLFIRMQLKGYKFILTSKSLIWHFGSRSGHFPDDDFSKTSERQIKREKENERKWITKWNKYPVDDENGFISPVGMKIIDLNTNYD